MKVLDILPLNVITKWWLHVDFFVGVELIIEIGTIEVESVDILVIVGGDSEKNSETGKTCNWGEGVKVVNALLLCEALSNEVGLVLFYGPTCLLFDVENPLAANNILDSGLRDCAPCVSTVKGGSFAIHHLLPFWPVGARICSIQSL